MENWRLWKIGEFPPKEYQFVTSFHIKAKTWKEADAEANRRIKDGVLNGEMHFEGKKFEDFRFTSGNGCDNVHACDRYTGECTQTCLDRIDKFNQWKATREVTGETAPKFT